MVAIVVDPLAAVLDAPLAGLETAAPVVLPPVVDRPVLLGRTPAPHVPPVVDLLEVPDPVVPARRSLLESADLAVLLPVDDQLEVPGPVVPVRRSLLVPAAGSATSA